MIIKKIFLAIIFFIATVFADVITDSRDGKKYKVVKIGTQTWMAENLNYETSDGSWCYNKCVKYGRLYDWATAMALPSACNSNSCASQIRSKHRGICPVGYHIPSNSEWETLMNYAGGEEIAGKKLKAASVWSEIEEYKDDYGFSALPGGMRYYNGLYNGGGYWWTSTERRNSNMQTNSRTNAYYRHINYQDELVWYDSYYLRYWDSNYKDSGLSVRCVKD